MGSRVCGRSPPGGVTHSSPLSLPRAARPHDESAIPIALHRPAAEPPRGPHRRTRRPVPRGLRLSSRSRSFTCLSTSSRFPDTPVFVGLCAASSFWAVCAMGRPDRGPTSREPGELRVRVSIRWTHIALRRDNFRTYSARPPANHRIWPDTAGQRERASAGQTPRSEALFSLWPVQDSNLRRYTPTDLQNDTAHALTCTFTPEQGNFRTTSPRIKQTRCEYRSPVQRSSARSLSTSAASRSTVSGSEAP